MTRVWTYPWTVLDEGRAELSMLSAVGVDGIALVGHYHSVETFMPRGTDGPQFTAFPGGCYFDPPERRFADLAIDPPVNTVESVEDPFGTAQSLAQASGLDVAAWTVCLHNSRLGATNPAFRIESAFGDAHDHALCPSHPEVRAYFATVVATLADLGVARIDLESVGVPSVRHGHGDAFGHAKNHAVAGETTEWLLSQCFCDGCRDAAPAAMDVDAVRGRVRDLCRQGINAAGEPHPDLATVRSEYPAIDRLFEFRADVVTAFVERLQAASGEIPLNYYVAAGFGKGAEDGWPAGVVLERLDDHLDQTTALCYTDAPTVASERIETLRGVTTGPVNAGVTMAPDVVDNRDQFLAVAKAARAAATGELVVYNHATMTEAHVDWLDAVA